MSRTLLRWFGPPLLAAVCSLPLAAQAPPAPGPAPGPMPVPSSAPATQEPVKHSAPVLQTAIAFLCTVIVMLIVCVPSRKS